MAAYLLALDQGTSSSRALLFDQEARLLAVHQIPLPVEFPQPGWVEQDPEAIWRSQRDAARAVLHETLTAEDRLLGIGIANQRETTIVWERETLTPIGPAIGWQCRRTADVCANLEAAHGNTIRARTGLVADAYFSGPKIAWLLDSVPGARARAEAGELVAGTVDSWLLAKLSGGTLHLTDRTNASRTMLFDIHRMAWDSELAAAMRVPIHMLPEVRPSIAEFGLASAETLGFEAPILSVVGDQQSALVGQACHAPGPAKVTYGTGAFLLAHTGTQAAGPVPGLLTTPAVAANGQPTADPAYALEGSVFSAGAVVQWLRDELQLIDESAAIETLAESTDDSGGVAFVPAFAGLGAPHWKPDTRAMLAGISRGTGAPQIARAVLESIAFRVREVVEALEAASDTAVAQLRVDGGAARNDLLLQIQANVLQRPVVRPAEIETTAFGAALTAGVSAGLWPDLQATSRFWQPAAQFDPNSDLEQAYTRWEAARDAAIALGS